MAEAVFRAPKGTRDIFAPESDRLRAMVDTFAGQAVRSGFGQVMSPIFEDIRVFERLGDSTEVVTKEMYDFHDRDQRHLALRPELTASVVRAAVQHRPQLPWKVWYEGLQFRYERPQAGRYRQFSQVGVETLGTDDPAADVEVIAVAARFFESLGLRSVTLLLNSLGDDACRPAYLAALRQYLDGHGDALSAASRATLGVNPLRVLDSKRDEDQPIIAAAPLMVDFLTDETAEHFDQVRAGLDVLEIDYQLSPRLVRGLDYYTRTTFEFAAEALDTAQNAVGGGGRYDGLAEALGGPAMPGVGFALGVDRILLACDAEDAFPSPATTAQVFVVDLTGGLEALRICDRLRADGIRVERAFDNRSMKSQMRSANKSGAQVAVLVGPDERAAGRVTVKDLASGEQHEVADEDLPATVRTLLTGDSAQEAQ